MYRIFLFISILILFQSCRSTSNGVEKSTTKITINFLDEYVFTDTSLFCDDPVGGISGIDYLNGQWMAISDAQKAPIRYYLCDLKIDDGLELSVDIKSCHALLRQSEPFKNRTVDPESIRFMNDKNIIWSSEGNINKGIDGEVFVSNIESGHSTSLLMPPTYKIRENKDFGPRQNGLFEGLSMSHDKKAYWISSELPLKQDGEAPNLDPLQICPIRISKIEIETGEVIAQYAYHLDAIKRPGKSKVSGMTEILELNPNTLLVLERAWSSGYEDGGNEVRLYQIDLSSGNDIRHIKSLSQEKSYRPLAKNLVFDFNTIRGNNALEDTKLTKLDNLEGMCKGPVLPNGNSSLIFVSDDNFQVYGPQLTQFLLFEIIHGH